MGSKFSSRSWVTIAILLLVQTMGILALAPSAQASNLVFGSTINLSSDTIASGNQVTAAVGSHVYVAWLNNSATNSIQNVLFRASSNNGTSFGPTIKVSNAPTQDSAFAQIAAARSYVYLAWEQNSTTGYHILFSSSSDNGTSFGTPVDITSNVSMLSQSQYPQLAAADKNVYVAWRATTTQGRTYIYVKGSASNGSNLATVTATRLSQNGNACISSCLDVSAVSKYGYLTWSDLGPTRPQTFFSFTSNNGTSFSTPVSINNNPQFQSDINQVVSSNANNVYVSWTNDTSSCAASCDNTMFRASSNNGVSFGPVMNLYAAQVTDLNPQLAASGKNVYVAWTNSTSLGAQILFRASNNNGTSFNSIINLSNAPVASNGPTVMATGPNVYVAWGESSTTTTDVYFASSSDNGLTFGAAQDLSPATGNSLLPTPTVSASGSNVFVAWEDGTQGNGDIFFRATVPGAPDVALTYVGLSKTLAYAGTSANPIIVNVTASNPGPVAASFVVSAKANGTFIAANQTVNSLAPGASVLVQFSWNTAALARGNYTLVCYGSQVSPPGETNLSNNVKPWGGTFWVRLKGDVSGDCRVDIVDLATVGSAFGKTIGDPAYRSGADLNNDGIINIIDLVDVASVFGTTC